MVVSRWDTTDLLSAKSPIYLHLTLHFINQILPRSQSFNLDLQIQNLDLQMQQNTIPMSPLPLGQLAAFKITRSDTW